MTQFFGEALTPGSSDWSLLQSKRQTATGDLAEELDKFRQLLSQLVSGRDGEGRALNGDARPRFRRDRDRILYSPSFSRLAGVTQVITPSTKGKQTHNRLTHSLKVAQIARSIAELLNSKAVQSERLERHGGANPDVAEAAALAHDLGHPPFGHVGEELLDKAAIRLGLKSGFEGNAQSFRIVTALETHDLGGIGLSLTYGTLAGLMKYPWPRRSDGDGFPEVADGLSLPLDRLRNDKFGCYGSIEEHEERDETWSVFERAMRLVPRDNAGRPVQSVEAAIMDVADDITYALHDLDDFYRTGLVTKGALRAVLLDWLEVSSENKESLDVPVSKRPGRLLHKRAQKLMREYPSRFSREAFDEAARLFVTQNLTALSDSLNSERDEITRIQSMISELITSFLAEIDVEEAFSSDIPIVHLSELHWHQVEILKSITRFFVISRPGLASVQRGQTLILKELVDLISLWFKEESLDRVPSRLREYFHAAAERGVNRDRAQARAVIDYVAGLTDLQAMELHRVLKGGHLDLAGAVVQ